MGSYQPFENRFFVPWDWKKNADAAANFATEFTVLADVYLDPWRGG